MRRLTRWSGLFKSEKNKPPREAPIYPEHLSSSTKDKEADRELKANEVKDEFYDTRRNLYGYELFGEEAVAPGYKLRVVPESEYHDLKLLSELYADCFLYIEHLNKLIFIDRQQEIEEIRLTNLRGFNNQLRTTMNVNGLVYLSRHLTNDQLYSLVTLNGGIMPESTFRAVETPGLLNALS